MSNHGENKSSKGLIVVIAIIIIVALGIGGYFLLKNKDSITTGGNNTQTSSKLNETITEENYEELTESVAEELGDSNDLYYFSYATMYYMMKDGMSSAFSGSEDESAMYTNIYGKTAKELIKEGKELMQENDVTIDEFKGSLENLENVSSNLE